MEERWHLLGFLFHKRHRGWLAKLCWKKQGFSDSTLGHVSVHLLNITTTLNIIKKHLTGQKIDVRLGLEIDWQRITIDQTVSWDNTGRRSLGENIKQRCLSRTWLSHECRQFTWCNIARYII